MQRAPIVLTATVTGLAATLGFHAHQPATTAAATDAATTSSASSGSPGASESSSSSGSSSSSSGSSSSGTGTVTSDSVDTRYGPIQLRVTISSGGITAIEPLQLPSGDPKSAQISSYAEPQLRQSALAKQSASIDAVSGATYTSEGYRTALQSALDAAGSASPGSTA
jgi:uncharacterized protein with FMN-binding domain